MSQQSSVWRRSPFDARFEQQFDALVRAGFGVGSGTGAGFTPAAEITRDGDDAVVTLDLPGVAADDVTVEVEQNRLVVRGERKDPRAEDARGRTERRYGTFRRSFSLPSTVTAEAVSASSDAGVLTVRVAGAHAAAQPTRIAVTTGA
ncbi:Hsp20/alpha crystallin family protein [Kineococcus rhizosphaerae]|uniref:HSP20 family molecular chaperone IbpA n=1 Tax=Kineococcus rhizosphaerae TaxID=559628 RepID=A0A2T0R2J1_9ACTN|nr:Hsp20/alpha crystallin family protein [Kineococcus rhizosphaerae]PRY14004.1 HSP20 family molecular chaperone IbpA [Kineococcus rhizosphaerae]